MRKTILKRVRDFPRNISRMLKNLPTKFKYNVAIYKLNVYKTSIKKSPLSHSSAPREILILKYFENQALPILTIYFSTNN